MVKSVRQIVRVGVGLLLAFGIAGPGPVHAQAADVVARDAWVRVPAPSKNETALYVVLENHGTERRAVVAVSSDAAASAEMHEMKMEGKMMAMGPVKQIAIAAKGKTELRPGGLHIMLFGLKAKPAIGDSVQATLTLDNGTTIPITATVRK